MLLSSLLGVALKKDVEVTRVVGDSRMVQQGDVFVYDSRLKSGIEHYVKQAKEQGAAAIVINETGVDESALIHPTPNIVWSKWAAAAWPKQPKHMLGVTGTNGKTSVSWFTAKLLEKTFAKTASLGTLGLYVNDVKVKETGYTSPTPSALHEMLEGLVHEGVEAACMEVSSHALALNRVDGVAFQAAAFTNLTRDHLDFHHTMENYAAAKYRLFAELLQEGGTAVIPIQRPESWALAALCKERDVRTLTFGSGNAELVVESLALDVNGQTLRVKYGTFEETYRLPLVGAFQGANLAAAIGLALGAGANIEDIHAQIPQVTAVPGRMEVLGVDADKPTVVIDYAHTDDSLATALQALRHHTQGKLWVVFGCGGDRDGGKRPRMGAAAHQLADCVIVTDDNPRTEDPALIRKAVLAAAPDAHEIGDREEAIAYAIQHAAAGDMVLVAGKGHETGQIVKGAVLPFDDVAISRRLLEQRASRMTKKA